MAIKNQFIEKFDFVRLTKDTEMLVRFTGDSDFKLFQMVELRSKNPEDYKTFPEYKYNDYRDHVNAEWHKMRTAFMGAEIRFEAPAGLELKIHGVDNPYSIYATLRNPVVLVAKLLGLDLAVKAEKKLAKTLADSIKGLHIDFTELDADTFAVIDDPRSKADKRRKSIMFGRTASYQDIVPGQSFVIRDTCHLTYLLHLIDCESTNAAAFKGQCLTVLSREEEAADERFPSYAVVKAKLLLAQGLSDQETPPRVFTAMFGAKNTDSIQMLSLVVAEDEQQGSETTEETE
jgi:hypothetical protein